MGGASGGVFRALGARVPRASSAWCRPGRWLVAWQAWRGVAGPVAAGLGGWAPGSGQCHVGVMTWSHHTYKPNSPSKPEAKPHLLQSGDEETALGGGKQCVQDEIQPGSERLQALGRPLAEPLPRDWGGHLWPSRMWLGVLSSILPSHQEQRWEPIISQNKAPMKSTCDLWPVGQ